MMSVIEAMRSYAKNLAGLRYREALMTLAVVGVLIPAVVLFPGFKDLAGGLKSGVSTPGLAVFAAFAVVSGLIKGVSGFGEALIITPVAASVIDPTAAVVALAIPPLMTNVFQIGDTRTGLEYVRSQWVLVLCALVGSFIGVYFLSSYASTPLIPLLIGVLILGYVIFQVVGGFATFEKAAYPGALGVVGMAEGFLLGAANFGPLLPAYLHSFERNAERYIGGLSMVLGLVFAERVIQMLINGLMTSYLLWLGAAVSLITLVGLGLGTALRRAGVKGRVFDWLVVGLLFVVSLNIFYNVIPKLI